MIRLFSLIFFLILFNLTVRAQSQQDPKFLDKKTFLSDVKHMFKNFEAIQVNAYLHISKEKLLLKRDSLVKTLPDPVPINDAFIAINQLAAYLKDTHTYVENYSPIFNSYKENLLFPLKIETATDRKIIVTKDYEAKGTLKFGDTLLTINGHSANLLFQKFIALQGGLLAYQLNEAKINFEYNLFLFNIQSPYIVTYKRSSSAEILADTLVGLKFSELRTLTRSRRIPDYSYQLLENNTAYISFKAMHGSVAKFKTFLDSCFSHMRSNKAKGLIVDLRFNGGGNSELGELLLSYLSRKPYFLSSGRYAKVSALYKQYMSEEDNNKLSNEFLKYQKAEEGKVLFYKYKKKNYFPDNPNFYPVKTCFLIGPQNLSSATMLADGAQHFKIATLIGQPTGAPANDGGESFSFILPYSKFEINTSSTFDIRANGSRRDVNAVIPDIYIKENNTDQDCTLNYAKEWISPKK